MKKKRKIVIVFGAYGGVGREVCRYNYIENDAFIVMSGRDEQKLKRMVNGYSKESVHMAIGDANKEADVRAVFEETTKKIGEPDEIWITIGKDGGWQRDYPSDYKKRGLREKLYPSLLQPVETICKVAEEYLMRQGHGVLVHLSSHVVFKDEDELPGNFTYRLLKKEAEDVVSRLRDSLKGSGATAVNLRPAIINTPGNAVALRSERNIRSAVQPEEMAKWVDESGKKGKFPENFYFHSDVVL